MVTGISMHSPRKNLMPKPFSLGQVKFAFVYEKKKKQINKNPPECFPINFIGIESVMQEFILGYVEETLGKSFYFTNISC